MSNSTLQIPVNKALRDKAAQVASHQGFSSLQEAVRVFLSQLARREVSLGFSYSPAKLSQKNETRYTKMLDEILSGKLKSKKFKDTDSIKNIMEYLDS